MVEQKKSVMEQCEQSGIVCWNSGTVYDGTVEQWNSVSSVEQCGAVDYRSMDTP